MKTAKEILENYEGKSPSSDGHGWVEMDSGGSWYYEDKVIEAMEEYANQDRWISVKDSLPGEGLDVLCISEEGCMSIEKRRYGKKEIYCDQTDSGYATHWQPLPNPPTK